jgi:quercetin dioxygenase-like cupin family protein
MRSIKAPSPYLLFKLGALSLATVLWCNLAAAQTSQPAVLHTCAPVSERTGELGCWILSDEPMGALTRTEAFWHLYVYPTRAAADADKGQRSTVVEGFGKIWLMTIDEESWKPPNGERVAKIGPLPFTPGEKYSAQYMEAIFTPGMTAAPHRHPGPEAWHTMSGQTCLETPEGVQTGRSGGPPVIVPGGLPMHLTATGSEKRRSIVLILHESSKPSMSPATDWTPKGLCTAG